jgi:hypothetical protein
LPAGIGAETCIAPTYTMYLDGAKSHFGTINAPTLYTGDSTTLYLGQKRDRTRFLNGLLDEVRIYNRALSAGEVQQLYSAGR